MQACACPPPPGAPDIECQMEVAVKSFDLGFLYLVVPIILALLAALFGGE